MKLSQTDRKDIVAAIQAEKVTMTELAERYKVSIQSISYVFKKMTGQGLMRQLSQSEIKAIVAELQAGNVTIKEAAAKYGVNRNTIADNFKKVTGTYLHPRRISQTDRKTIVAALQSGTESKELSSKYGVTTTHIGQIYKKETGTMLRQLPHLSHREKETIVAEVQSGKASQRKLAAQFNINRSRVSSVLKATSAIQESEYRAWHKKQRKMYPVFGIDWFNRKILIPTDVFVRWYNIDHFIMMAYSGLRDRKRTPEYPEGQEICVGDIVRFPILLEGHDGKTKETIVKDIVTFDREYGGFIVSELDDPLALHNDECEVIGNIYEHPDPNSKAA